MIISVDFDGTITKAAHPDEVGFNQLRPHCKEVMSLLSLLGVKFLLLTGRESRYISEAVQLCERWGLPIDTEYPNIKRSSDFYIDDKNIDTKEIDWIKIYNKIVYKLVEEL